jgi:hypothetical protein
MQLKITFKPWYKNGQSESRGRAEWNICFLLCESFAGTLQWNSQSESRGVAKSFSSALKNVNKRPPTLPQSDLHFPPKDLQQPSVTYIGKKQPIRMKGRGQVKSVSLVLWEHFLVTARNVNKSPHPFTKWPTFSCAWPWTTFSDLHWEETANQNQGVGPSEYCSWGLCESMLRNVNIFLPNDLEQPSRA